ncbi:golgin subfamily A member 2 isoform X2 [Belonocnema kinseyi]|uniref:golgin subfamily A member 2 isoform X2 n=1 Tax=Belonocnema kinseyi TaxID=2817044 RepID=UPI00143D22BB|nr:golgin subfamily A member 2 isoform X2 [Belonocnema kinseyi]
MDKEKLLAARKKLKEYQLHKKDTIYEQQDILRNKDEGSELHTTLESVIRSKIEKIEENSCSQKIKIQEIQSRVYTYPPENLLKTNKSSIKSDLSLEENSQYETAVDQISNVDTRSNNSLDLGVIQDTSFLQTEHLLQMAFSVANALGDNNESTEMGSLGNLSEKNEFLKISLQEHRILVNQLHSELSRQSSRVSKLEAILTTKDAEFKAKHQQELYHLQEKLQLHTHTTGILVAEKAELCATIAECQETIKQKTEFTEDLYRELKSCRLHVTELEKEVANSKSSSEEMKRGYQQELEDYDKLLKNLSILRKEKDDLELEASELKQKLNLKNTELWNLQQELQEKNAICSLNELKIQQLTNSSQHIQTLENRHLTSTVHEQQLAQLKEALNSLNNEKDEASKQYRRYVEQLDEQNKKVIHELELARKKIAELELKDRSYIQRLSEMEQQLHRESEQVVSLKPLLEHKNQIDILTRHLDNLVIEQESLHLALSRKDVEIENLTKELQELQELNQQNLNASKLATALESEQLGASRAVSQNQQLKRQLNEMQNAFVLLSNSKLDLTEQLQAQRSISKKQGLQLNQYESQLQELRDQLKEKEVTVAELEKEKMFSAQMVDKVQHFEAKSYHSRTLQQELLNAQILAENLKRENGHLSEKLDIQEQDARCELDDDHNSLIPITHDIRRSKLTYVKTQLSPKESLEIPQSLQKLESRFKEAMQTVAELTDDKQRLEHLVLQLQGETETIGEYVTLYQRQRFILQEKAKEREQHFKQIAVQRNQQQQQLQKLKILVADLITNKSTNSINIDIVADRIKSLTSSFKQHLEHPDNKYNSDDIQFKKANTDIYLEDEAASQILDLLSEIKDCNDSCVFEPNSYPCPWCSGELITV